MAQRAWVFGLSVNDNPQALAAVHRELRILKGLVDPLRAKIDNPDYAGLVDSQRATYYRGQLVLIMSHGRQMCEAAALGGEPFNAHEVRRHRVGFEEVRAEMTPWFSGWVPGRDFQKQQVLRALVRHITAEMERVLVRVNNAVRVHEMAQRRRR